jgi:hypothetical protein
MDSRSTSTDYVLSVWKTSSTRRIRLHHITALCIIPQTLKTFYFYYFIIIHSYPVLLLAGIAQSIHRLATSWVV